MDDAGHNRSRPRLPQRRRISLWTCAWGDPMNGMHGWDVDIDTSEVRKYQLLPSLKKWAARGTFLGTRAVLAPFYPQPLPHAVPLDR